jgi:putrescine importer
VFQVAVACVVVVNELIKQPVYRPKEGRKEGRIDMSNQNTLLAQGPEEVKLKKTIGFWGMVFFGVIMLNPMSIMAYFGYEQLSSGGHTTMLYIVATVVVFFTCLSYSRMVEVFPSSGSAYVYTTKSINGKLGFLVGWAMLIDYAIAPMYLFQLPALYINRLYPQLPVIPLMILFAIIALVVNIFGLKLGDRVNGGITVALIFSLSVFAVFAIYFLFRNGTPMGFVKPLIQPSEFNFSGMMKIMPLAILSFMGFDGISTLTEESKEGPKQVGKAMKTSVLIAGGLLIGFAYLSSLLIPDWHMIETPDTVGMELQIKVGMKTTLITALTLLNQSIVIATTITTITAASRLIYVMGRNSVLPKKVFGKLSPKFSTPVTTIVIVIAVNLAGAIIFHWEIISEIVAFGMSFGFICVNLSVISYFWFKVKQRNRPFINLILPAIGAVTIVFVLINSSAYCKLVGVIWVAIGAVYLAIQYKRSEAFRESVDEGIDMSEIEG